MQDVVRDPRAPFAPTIAAEARAGSRVSWGAVLSGTVTMLAIAVILWALALAIVSLVMHPTAASLKGAAIALWVCAMATTLVGALVGGIVAGSSARAAPRRLAMMHGFVAWGLALLVSFAFHLYLMGGSFEATTSSMVDAVAAQAPGAARGAFAYLAGASWSWFGTWAIAGVLSVAGAAIGARRRRVLTAGEEPIFERQQPPGQPLTPVTSS
jgi:hypothetical protein